MSPLFYLIVSKQQQTCQQRSDFTAHNKSVNSSHQYSELQAAAEGAWYTAGATLVHAGLTIPTQLQSHSLLFI